MSHVKLKATPFQTGVDYADKTSLWERLRLNDIANGFKAFAIGGSRHVGIDGTGLQDSIDYQEFELDGNLLGGYTIRARVEIKTAATGTTIRPLIWDVTSGAELATTGGSAANPLVWTKQTLVLTLPPVARFYKLRFEKNNATNLVFGIGYLEIKTS